MKIGLLSTSKQLNYGGVLQAFALLKVVQSIAPGHSIETVNIDITSNSEELVGEKHSSLLRIWKRPSLKRLLIRFLFPLEMRRHRRRRRRTVQFLEENMKQGRVCHHEPADLWADPSYDLFIVGSDQVWRYQSRIHKFCLLAGFPQSPPRRIAYAVSLGWSQLPDKHYSEYFESLSRFDAISIREPTGVEAIQRLLGGSVPVQYCVDPTILLGREKWRGYMEKQMLRGDPDVPYAFVYWLDDLDFLEPIFQGLCEKGFRRIVVAFSWYNKALGGNLFEMRRLMDEATRKHGVDWRIDLGPNEFLVGIAHASYVVANSFHAMMFSLVFHLPARIFVKLHGEHDLMAPRMLDFAKRYQIKGVVCEGVEGNCDFALSAPLDYEAIWRRIEPDRRASMEFLVDSMKACGVGSDAEQRK